MRKLFGRSKKQEAQAKALGETQTERDIVRELSEGDDDLYRALSYLLLLNPERLLESKTIDSYLAENKQALEKKDQIKARIALETALRLSLFQGEVARLKSLVSKCSELVETGERTRIYEIVQTKLDRVLSASRKYYEMRKQDLA